MGTSNSLPALYDPILTASESGSSPLRTISIIMGTAVSTPGMPDGASANGRSFSSAAWGAWSVPSMSNPPPMKRARRASLLRASLSGGFTLYSAPGLRSASNVMWCMVHSVEKPASLAMARPSGVVRWQMFMLDPRKFAASLDMAFHSASAGRFLRWSLQHRSSPFDIRWSSSAWTLMRLPVASTSLTAGIISSSSSRRMFPEVDPMNSLNPTTMGASIPALTPAVTAANRP